MKVWQLAVGIALGLLLFVFLIIGGCSTLFGVFLSSDVFNKENVVVQPTENVQSAETQKETITTPQKVKSATLTVDRVVETLSNLDKIRLTIKNTGDISITPKFDVIVTDNSGNNVCEGSPMWGVGIIGAGQEKTDEIQLLGCMFNQDGNYAVKVDLLDEDFKKLDSAEKTLTVNYWSQFQI